MVLHPERQAKTHRELDSVLSLLLGYRPSQTESYSLESIALYKKHISEQFYDQIGIFLPLLRIVDDCPWPH
jgi:hypothetical protein